MRRSGENHRLLLRCHSGVRRCGNPPDAVADIVGDQQATLAVRPHIDRPAESVTLTAEEAGRAAARMTARLAIGEGHEDDLVAAVWLAVPGTVLADEGAIGELLV